MENNNVNMTGMKSIDLSQAKHQLVTMPIYFLVALFVAGWVGKPWLADVTGLVTVAQAAESVEAANNATEDLAEEVAEIRTTQLTIQSAFSGHVVEFRMDAAMRMVEQFEDRLARHEANPMAGQNWLDVQRDLIGKITLAREYKTCIRNEQPNCNLLQQQLWQ